MSDDVWSNYSLNFANNNLEDSETAKYIANYITNLGIPVKTKEKDVAVSDIKIQNYKLNKKERLYINIYIYII